MMSDQAAEQEQSARPYRWLLLSGIWLLYFCFGLTTASMAPLIPAIAADLNIDNAAFGFILGAWPLIYIAAAIPCGAVLDSWTPRFTMTLGGLVIALSGAARAAAETHLALFLAVALFGIGGPLISIGAPKLVSQWFDDRNRGMAMGLYITGPALGNVAALSLTNSIMMPLFSDNWRMVFLVYAGAAGIATLIWFVIAGMAGTGEAGIGSRNRTPFRFASVLDILSLGTVQIVLLMAVGAFFINHGINNWLPEILRFRGLSAVDAGFWSSVPTAVGIAGSLTIPRLATPARRPALLAGLFAAVMASSLLLLLPFAETLAPALLFIGIARGSVISIIMLILMDAPGLSRERLGLAGGLFFVAGEIGGVAGPVTIGALSQWSGGFTLPVLAFTTVSGVLVLLALLLVLSNRNRA
jgi:cyanate permease